MENNNWQAKENLVTEKFSPEFIEQFKHDPMFYKVYNLLIRDADPYKIIEELVRIIKTSLSSDQLHQDRR